MKMEAKFIRSITLNIHPGSKRIKIKGTMFPNKGNSFHLSKLHRLNLDALT